jgi:hypothetical protein
MLTLSLPHSLNRTFLNCYSKIFYLKIVRRSGRRKRVRPKLAEGIRGMMGEKGLMEEDWNDRSKWRKKII